MPTPFAALEARVTATALAKLANAVADFGGGVTVDGIFDNDYAQAFDLVGGSAPAFEGPAAALVTAVRGTALTINGTAYTVALKKPDGMGATVLILEAA